MTNAHKIKHLYARAGFGLSFKEWQDKKTMSVDKAVRELMNDARKADVLPQHALVRKFQQDFAMNKSMGENRKKGAELRKQGRLIMGQLNADWVKRMGDKKESALLEKMCLFWHGHFACTSKNPVMATNQLNVFRAHGLGNFKDLVLAIAKDPSMIRFLNNQQNRKNSPNENFTRELMELFTIGRGNYTEQDVKEGARAFTGWSSNRRGAFVFRKRQHDYGQKTFMGKRGNWDGEDIIDIILENPRTAEFITRKIYRYFVNYKVDEGRIQELSESFYQSGYDIGALMERIFRSAWFYDEENIGAKIKSPVEYIAGLIRSFDLQTADYKTLVFIERALGQTLFNPPNVAGWAGGRAWIDNATLMLRLNLIEHFFRNSDVNLKVKEEFEAQKRNRRQKKFRAKIDIQSLVSQLKNKDEETILENLTEYFFPKGKVNERLINRYTYHHSKTVFIQSAILRLTSLPEYQMC